MTTILAPADEMKDPAGFRIVNIGVEPTAGEIDWAAEHLGDLPTVVGFDEFGGCVREWQDGSGRWWRSCGTINVFPTGEVARFRIRLFAGATLRDLRWLERMVAQAQAGSFINSGWEPSAKTPGAFYFGHSRSIAEPGTKINGANDMLVPCDEPLCEEHTEFNGWHLADDPELSMVEHSQPKVSTSDDHRVALTRMATDPVWTVNVQAEGDLNEIQLASLISDLQWAMADLKKSNSAPLGAR